MTANPVELIGGLTSTSNVPKADIVAWAKARVPQVFTNAAEVNGTTLTGQNVIYVKSLGAYFVLDVTDTTTANNGTTVLVSSDGKRFKIISDIPTPTAISLGGVYSSSASANNFATGIDTLGNVTYARPSAANLSNGTTGTGAVVLANAPTLVTPNIGAATGTSLTLSGAIQGASLEVTTGDIYISRTSNNTGYIVRPNSAGNKKLAFAVTGGGALELITAVTDVFAISGTTASTSTTTGALVVAGGVGIAGNLNVGGNIVGTFVGITTSMFAANVVDTDSTLAANSTTRIPAQSAVKSYVDNLLTGLSWKASVDAATTANITLSGTQTIDGVAVVAGNRVLVKNQSTGSQNGIYVVAAGAWSRAADMDTAAEFPSATVFVEGGTVNGDTQWTCSNDSVTVGSTAVTFAQVSGAGTYSAGTGLMLTGNQFAIDSTVVTLNGAQTLTNKTLTAPNLGTPTAITLTNGTGLPISTGVSGLGTGIATFLATPTSANLRAALGDESGNGLAYFQGGDLGTPTAGVLTNCTGLPTAGLVNNAVTFAKMQTINTASFLGRTTAATGNVENLTATQATAILNAMVGDTGTGGTKGLVPTPGAGDAAAGKYLDAGGNWSVPAGGGGGGMTNAERQDARLSGIRLAETYGDLLRILNAIRDGFMTSNGINAGASSNYTVTSTSPALSYVAPTAGSNALISTSGKTLIGNMTGNGGLAAAFDGNTNQANTAGASTTGNSTAGYTNTAGVDWGSGTTKTVVQFKVYAPNNFGILGGAGGSSLKLQGSNDNSNWDDLYTSGTVLTTGGSSIDITSGITLAAYRYHRVAINGNGANSALVAEVQFYETGTLNNMTVVSTAQTAPSSVSNGRVLIEYEPIDAITLNTHLTVEVTCNGGTNWASATLSSAGVGQSGRLVAETADTACTAGTSFAVRIKSLSNKNVRVHGFSLDVH